MRVTVWKRRGCGPCEAVVRELIPQLDCEVAVKDVHDHPCEAMREGIDYLPTIVVERGRSTYRIRGFPSEEIQAEILGI